MLFAGRQASSPLPPGPDGHPAHTGRPAAHFPGRRCIGYLTSPSEWQYSPAPLKPECMLQSMLFREPAAPGLQADMPPPAGQSAPSASINQFLRKGAGCKASRSALQALSPPPQMSGPPQETELRLSSIDSVFLRVSPPVCPPLVSWLYFSTKREALTSGLSPFSEEPCAKFPRRTPPPQPP